MLTTQSPQVQPREAEPARLARVWHDLPSIVGWAALVLFALLSIGSPLRGEGTFLQTGMLLPTAPWSSVLADAHAQPNILVADTVNVISPQTMLITEAARQGHFQQWSPYGGGGVELAGVPNSGAYSPLSLPWWVLPASFAPGVVKLLEILAITLGMSLLLRRLRLPQATWPLASLAYASSGFMISWTNWPQTRVAALIPLLFWAVDRAAVRGRPRDAIPVGLVVAGLLLGGFPAVTGYALYAAGVWALVRAIGVRGGASRAVPGLLAAAAGVVLGGLLSAWQMLPFAITTGSLVDFAAREGGPTAHVASEALASALVPHLAGGPDSFGWIGHPVEVLSYVGVAVLLLALVALVVAPWLPQRRTVLAYLIASLGVVVVLVYVGGWPLALAQKLPIFDNNYIGRVRSVSGFLTAVLAAHGYAVLLARVYAFPESTGLRPVRPKRLVSVAVWGAFVALVVFLLGRQVVDVRPLIPDAAQGIVRSEFRLAALFGLLVLAACALALARPGRKLAAAALILVPMLVAAQAIPLAGDWWRTSSSESFYPDTPTHTFLAEHLGGDRFETAGGVTMLPGTNTVYRIRSLGGHNFQTAEWKDLIKAVDPGGIRSPTYTQMIAANLVDTIDSPILDRLAVRYIVTDPSLAPLGDGVGDGQKAGAAVQLSADSSLRSSVQTGPIRGVRLTFPAGAKGPEGVRVTVRIVEEGSGAELASTSTWARQLPGRVWVALTGEQIAAGTAWRAVVQVTGIQAPVPVAGTQGGDVDLRLVRPIDDGVVVAHTGDATVYERRTALPRVRWANQAMVVTDPAAQVAVMAAAQVPRTGVLLEREQDAARATGSSATITDAAPGSTDKQAFTVDATGPGWLIVADSLARSGWTATVDGQPAQILPAEHAAGAIRVEAGKHDVLMTYRTPGLGAGLAITLATAFGLLAVVFAGWFLPRRRRAARLGAPVDDSALDAPHPEPGLGDAQTARKV